MFNLFSRLHPQDRFLKKSHKVVSQIHQALARIPQDCDIIKDYKALKVRHQAGETLDSLLPETFALVSFACKKLLGHSYMVCDHPATWDMVPYDVQLIGAIALHQGSIAEMSTGEGKTLVATAPIILNALSGKNIRLATVNDYLARRDAEWMQPLYSLFGLTIGYLQGGFTQTQRVEIYNKDITYGTATEFGFDYLRDHSMAQVKEQKVQHDHHFLLIDEVDSVLIDEARTPLIIAGPAPEPYPWPFPHWAPAIKQLVVSQTRVCNELLTVVGATPTPESLMALLLVKMGMPHHRILKSKMQIELWRTALDKHELQLSDSFRKEELIRQQEHLYFVVDERTQDAHLTAKGYRTLDQSDLLTLPELLNPTPEIITKYRTNCDHLHTVVQLLRAYTLYDKDVEYLIQDNQIHIIDPHTGRLMPGRRWSDGLHQAIEAKENVTLQPENLTYATITLQNYVRYIISELE